MTTPSDDTATPSPLLSLPGAVATTPSAIATGRTAWHYGGPLTEQRAAVQQGTAVFDRSDRDLITVTGEPRLTWLHSLTTQHLTSLKPHQGTETLILSPTGRVEHHMNVYDDGETTWLDTEPGRGEALLKYLQMMKFRTEVDIEDASADWALFTWTFGESLEDAEPTVQPVPPAKFVQQELLPVPTAVYPGAPLDAAPGWTRRTDALGVRTYDVLEPREVFAEDFANVTPAEKGLAGTWAFDALRVAAGVPRFGIDTDEKTVPHEVPHWLSRAVHFNKGCYRGQETVAKVHHLGQSPRRLVMLHLDGSDEHPPATGTPVTLDGKEIGFIGTAVQHYEDGQIALAVLKRSVAQNQEAKFLVDGQSASF
ncbi:folate-binding protein [Glycomyces sp. NPDC046736]|uniref:CAF17-like 4Fe-4S cluster assembly/insertion protein YgfZ n=1 Tax=Glycomyces sp. NPDC046736 TaxID=3155615 RepID=UPI0033D61D52